MTRDLSEIAPSFTLDVDIMQRPTFALSSLLPGLLGPLLLGLAACGDPPLDRLLPDEATPAASDTSSTPLPTSIQTPEAPTARRITLTKEQRDRLNLQTTTVRNREISYTLALPGDVQAAPDYVAQVSAPISGRVARMYAHEGEAVREGSVLLELESLEFAHLVADHLQAEAEKSYLEQRARQLQILVDKKISPRNALEKVESELARAHASVDATHARLRALGLAPADFDRDGAPDADRPLLSVTAPLSGTIDRHRIELGQSVTAYQEMLTIVNTSRVLIKGYVSPEEAAALAPGDAVTVLPERATGRQLDARVTTVNPAVDPESKSVTVNILAAPQERWPMPGQTVQLHIRVQSPGPVIAIPPTAVVYEGDRPIVYLQRDALTYERHPITIARTGEDEIIVADGLQDGDRIVTHQVFSLKALDRYTQYAEDE